MSNFILLCISGTYKTISMIPDNPGEWAVVCRTNDHFNSGMVAKFKVNECGSQVLPVDPIKTRTYYIAAVEDVWDYGPSGMNKIRETELDKDE